MGIVNACQKIEKEKNNNEIYINGLQSSAYARNLIQKQTKSENHKQIQQENNDDNEDDISPIKQLMIEQQPKTNKSNYSAFQDKGLMENCSLKILKIEQNETRLLNQIYSADIMNNSVCAHESSKLYQPQQHLYSTCSHSLYSKSQINSIQFYYGIEHYKYLNNRKQTTKSQSNTFYSKSNNQTPDFRPSRLSDSSNLTRSTHSSSLHHHHHQAVRKRVKQIYENGSSYEGQVQNGLRDGQGTFTYSQQGAKYVGQWEQGNIAGYGILYFSNDRVAYEGKWNDNQFNGNGVVYNENQEILEDKKSTLFDFRNFDNLADFWIKYDGNFLDDQKHGLGTLYLKNGEKYVGNFNKDSVDGNGAYYQLNGTIILGQWSNNHLVCNTYRINS